MENVAFAAIANAAGPVGAMGSGGGSGMASMEDETVKPTPAIHLEVERLKGVRHIAFPRYDGGLRLGKKPPRQWVPDAHVSPLARFNAVVAADHSEGMVGAAQDVLAAHLFAIRERGHGYESSGAKWYGGDVPGSGDMDA